MCSWDTTITGKVERVSKAMRGTEYYQILIEIREDFFGWGYLPASTPSPVVVGQQVTIQRSVQDRDGFKEWFLEKLTIHYDGSN